MAEIRKGVFVDGTATEDALKACSLFWERVYVYPRVVEEAVHDMDLFSVIRPLLAAGIVKVVLDPGEKSLDIYDKVSYGGSREAWEYFEKNRSNVVVNPTLPSDSEELVRQATERDLQNTGLIEGIKQSALGGINKRWQDGLKEAMGARGIKDLPEELNRAVWEDVSKAVEIDKEYRLEHPTWDESTLRYRNETLLQELSLADSLHIDVDDLGYYAMKLNGFKTQDAKRYESGWEALVPMAGRTVLTLFKSEEIVRIRKKRSWDNAMNKLAEICQLIAESPYNPKFIEEAKTLILAEYQRVLEEYRVDVKTTAKRVGKVGAMAGLSAIPILGAIGAGVSIADPVLNHVREEGKQLNLPFFINEIKRNNF